MGAMLALLAAHRHPDKVKRIVLFSGTPSFLKREGWEHGIEPGLLGEFMQAIQVDVEVALLKFIAMFNYNDAKAKDNVRELSDFNIPNLNCADRRPGDSARSGLA